MVSVWLFLPTWDITYSTVLCRMVASTGRAAVRVQPMFVGLRPEDFLGRCLATWLACWSCDQKAEPGWLRLTLKATLTRPPLVVSHHHQRTKHSGTLPWTPGQSCSCSSQVSAPSSQARVISLKSRRVYRGLTVDVKNGAQSKHVPSRWLTKNI